MMNKGKAIWSGHLTKLHTTKKINIDLKTANVLGFLGGSLVWLMIYNGYIGPHTQLDETFVAILVWMSSGTLELLGYDVIESAGFFTRIVGIKQTSGLIVGDPCNGLSAIIINAIYLISVKPTALRTFKYIVLSAILLHTLNVVRVVGLSIVYKHIPGALPFSHDYVFNVVIYAAIFGIWISYIKRSHE